MSIAPEGKNFSYLSIRERQALQGPKADKTGVLKEADKGSAVVVWDREDYCTGPYRQVNNSSVYEELVNSPITQLEKEVNNTVSEIQVCKQALTEKEVNNIVSEMS